MIVPGSEPKVGKERGWEAEKKKQVRREKATLLDLLVGSCKYLCKKDRVCILFVSRHVPAPVDKDCSQRPQERRAGARRTAKNKPRRGLEHTLYLTQKCFLELLLIDGTPEGRGERRRGLGCEQGLVGEQKRHWRRLPGPQQVAQALVWDR